MITLWKGRMPRTVRIGSACLSLGPFLLLLLAGAAARTAQAATDPAAVPFADRTVTTGAGTFRYEVFVPAHWNGRRKCPVILFLHGSGERGDDNRAQTKNGIRLLIAQDLDHFPAVVVCPQCRDHMGWTDPAMEQMALAALDQSVREFNGDPQRVYLTGLSLGGYGTWDLAQKYPDRWAALAPCCGGIRFHRRPAAPPAASSPAAAPIAAPSPGSTPSPDRNPASNDGPPADPYFAVAQKIVHLPVWVFHGEADPTVPVSESRQMVAVLYALKADVRYSEYPGVGHNSWDYAYKEPGLLPWLLSHKRPH